MLKRLSGAVLLVTALVAVVSIFTPLLASIHFGFKIAVAVVTLAAGLYCAFSPSGKTEYRYNFQDKRAKEDAKYRAKQG